MRLSQILSKIRGDFQIVENENLLNEIEINSIEIDSRLVKENSIFFALENAKFSKNTKDGYDYLESAISNKARVIVVRDDFEINDKLIKNNFCLAIKTKNTFDLLVEFLKIFYHKLPKNIYAITGTNGKTSTAEFTRQILSLIGKESASIGTLGVISNKNINFLNQPSLTTPDIISLYKVLFMLKQNQIDDVVLEASSIGLDQNRIAGLNISAAAFTNFTQDHLDYHQNMDEYFNCKMLLFKKFSSPESFAILNSDIEKFSDIKKICFENDIKVVEYGLKAKDFKIESIKNNQISIDYNSKKYFFKTKIIGEFQYFNMICALALVASVHNLNSENLELLFNKFESLNSASGRMQLVEELENGAKIFIDFAHSPDSLENVLHLAKQNAKNRVIVLFGCGGDRDTKKRSIMGKIACDLADLSIITDDNPRNESPQKIRQEIILGFYNQKKMIEISDRKIAIKKAIDLLEAGDILILTGKGHEKYQIIQNEKIDFDEEKIVKDFLKN